MYAPGAATIALLLTGALIVGCGGDSEDDGPPTAEVTAIPIAATPSPEATMAPEAAPMPERLTFAPGETISADGKAGIFFLDPATGAAEAWVVPAEDRAGSPLSISFSVGGISADGSTVVYTCREVSSPRPSPCGGESAPVWHLLDTRAGSRTRLDAFSGDFLSISPDGTTLLGQTTGGIALADAARPADTRPVTLPNAVPADVQYVRADWSPDGARVVLTFGGLSRSTFLIDVAAVNATEIDATSIGGVRWSPDGTRLAFARYIDDFHGQLVVADRDGDEIWSKPIATGYGAGVWSADGLFIFAEEQEQPATAEFGALHRVIVLDATTGATAYRVRGAFCPIGWAGRSHTLLTASYGAGLPIVDLDERSLRLIDDYVMPAPFDDKLAIAFDGSDFYSYDLSTQARALIARTTVRPAWDFAHEPLFVGRRLVFAPWHGGHGGCGEGNSPQDPPPPELLTGPFADDAPVIRGGTH